MPKDKIEIEFEKAIERFFYLIIVVAFIGGILSIPKTIVNWIIQLLISGLIGAIFSFLSGTIVQAFTGHILEKFSLTITIKNHKFSITAFVIATWIVQRWLFNS